MSQSSLAHEAHGEANRVAPREAEIRRDLDIMCPILLIDNATADAQFATCHTLSSAGTPGCVPEVVLRLDSSTHAPCLPYVHGTHSAGNHLSEAKSPKRS